MPFILLCLCPNPFIYWLSRILEVSWGRIWPKPSMLCKQIPSVEDEYRLHTILLHNARIDVFSQVLCGSHVFQIHWLDPRSSGWEGQLGFVGYTSGQWTGLTKLTHYGGFSKHTFFHVPWSNRSIPAYYLLVTLHIVCCTYRPALFTTTQPGYYLHVVFSGKNPMQQCHHSLYILLRRPNFPFTKAVLVRNLGKTVLIVCE